MHRIDVSIVYATVDQQWCIEKSVLRGTSAAELLELSGFLKDIKSLVGMSMEELQLGVYAEKVAPDHLLEQGDRVEVYRPLTADPKEVRRQLARLGKTIGKSKASSVGD